MTLRRWLPLIMFVVPTIVIGYGFVIPRSCIAGVNELTIAAKDVTRPIADRASARFASA